MAGQAPDNLVVDIYVPYDLRGINAATFTVSALTKLSNEAKSLILGLK